MSVDSDSSKQRWREQGRGGIRCFAHGSREFGATDVVSARGEEGVNEVRELAGGDGTHVVLECVGNMPA